jgi:hypothetical protein
MKKSSKKDTIVAVRIPRSLLEELQELKKINHFMDISDEIRFVIRRYIHNREQVDNTVFEELKRKEKLIKDLNNIILQLKGEENVQ